MKNKLNKILQLCLKPFKWIWKECKDIHTLIIFIISFLIVSSEVWIPYLLSFIFWNNTTIRNSLISFASACWLWWLLPVGSPFLLITISLTMGIKLVFDKIKQRRNK